MSRARFAGNNSAGVRVLGHAMRNASEGEGPVAQSSGAEWTTGRAGGAARSARAHVRTERRGGAATRAIAFLLATTTLAAITSLGCKHEKHDDDPSATPSASAPLKPPPDESGKVSLDLSPKPLDPKNAPKIAPSAPRRMAPVLPDEPGDCKSDNDCGLKDGEVQICCIQPGDNHKGPALGCQSKSKVCWKPCITDSDCPVKQQCKVVPGAGLLGCGF